MTDAEKIKKLREFLIKMHARCSCHFTYADSPYFIEMRELIGIIDDDLPEILEDEDLI